MPDLLLENSVRCLMFLSSEIWIYSKLSPIWGQTFHSNITATGNWIYTWFCDSDTSGEMTNMGPSKRVFRNTAGEIPSTTDIYRHGCSWKDQFCGSNISESSCCSQLLQRGDRGLSDTGIVQREGFKKDKSCCRVFQATEGYQKLILIFIPDI